MVTDPAPAPCPRSPSGAECAAFLRHMAAAQGCDVHVSRLPPLVPGVYPESAFTCPHGVTYWMEPTGEQIARWVADGVA